jgi:[acyl-carrier-protein] S-malonyltransferase
MKAYVFPGQGSQYPGMGKELYESSAIAAEMFERANEILGFRISDIMFNGSADQLRATNVTQPAVFLHSVILAQVMGITPDAVAGHSLGEFSALVAAGALSFEQGLTLVAKRAAAMHKACQQTPGAMAAVITTDIATIENICRESKGVVVAANYNAPGQTVISGEEEAVNAVCAALKVAGIRRALLLPVAGAFHSPLMESARTELEQAIAEAEFTIPRCPIYQNVDSKPHTDPEQIKANLIKQLTAPVRWSQSVEQMIADGINSFTEVGCGTVLQGLIRKTNSDVEVESVSII